MSKQIPENRKKTSRIQYSIPQKNIVPPTISKENIFTALDEKFDYKKCIELLLSGIADESYYNSILKYLKYSKNSKKDKNFIYYNKVTYMYPNNNIGRLKPCILQRVKDNNGNIIDMPVSCMTQTSMWNELKSFILKDLYYDVDIVNCQPSILEHLMVKHSISNKYINIYNNNRESFLKEMMSTFKIDRKQAKTIIIKIMFGGVIEKNMYDKMPKDIKLYIQEVKTATQKLLAIYPQYLEESKRLKELNGKKYNYEGSALALLLQTEERKVLECIYHYFTINGFIVGALISDGCHLEKSKNVNDTDLNNCSNYIYDKLGYKLKIIIKDFMDIKLNEMPIKKIFDPLNIDNHHVILNNINCDRICPTNGDPFTNISLFNNKNKLKEIILVKAKTGDGKTYFAKQAHNYIKNNKEILKKYIPVEKNEYEHFSISQIDFVEYVDKEYEKKEPSYDIKFLSLVSRVSLSYSHEIEFGLTNYQDTNKHGLDEVYQLDSIDKFINNNDDYYVLFLDEVASLCSHFNNNMNKMRQNRLKMVEIFRKIINDPKCIQIIGCDDNLNDGTIEFIRNLTRKPIYLYINNKVNIRNQQVNIHTDLNNIIKQMKNDIKSGTKIFCCSNRNAKFFKSIIRPIVDELKLKPDEYLIYSGDYGTKLSNYIDPVLDDDNSKSDNDTEFKGKIITADWNKPEIKIIFCTPSILYGVSYDEKKTHKVYGYYFNNSPINSLNCNQQINRLRDPIEINLYIEKQIFRPYKDLETCEAYVYNQILEDESKEDKKYKKVCNAINELFIYDQYVDSYYNDIFYYLPYLLKKKGYTNINVVVNMEKSQKKYNDKDYNDILVNEYKEGKLDAKKTDSVNIYLKSFGFSKKFIREDEELAKIEKDIRDNVLEIFTNNKYTRCLELYKKLHYRTFEKNLEEYNDTKLMKLYSDDYNIKLLDELHNLLGVKWFDNELLTKLESNKKELLKPFSIPNDLYMKICHKSRFNVRMKNRPNNYIECVIFLLKRYTMFSTDIIVSKSNNLDLTINNKRKQYSIPKISKLTEIISQIINYEKDISQLKLQYDNLTKNKEPDYLF